VNLGIVTGLLITNVIQGESLPPVSKDAAGNYLPVPNTDWWRFGFLFPVVNSILSILSCIIIAKKDSIFYLMDK